MQQGWLPDLVRSAELGVLNLFRMHSPNELTARNAAPRPSRVLELTYTAWDLEPFARDCLREGMSIHAKTRSREDREHGSVGDMSNPTEPDPRLGGITPKPSSPLRAFASSRESPNIEELSGTLADRDEGFAGYWKRYSPHSPFAIHHSPPPFVWDEARRFQLRCQLDAAFFHLYGLSRDDSAYILDTFPIVRRKDEAAHGTYRTKDTILAIYDELAEAERTGKHFLSPLDPPPGDERCCHPAKA
jgi:hypothetical protein